jgi:glycosyltransferase involved in cell wall biosynthesis
VDLVFFASIYDPQFAAFRLARPFFRRPWSGLYMDSRAIRKPGTKFLYSDEYPCPQKIFTARGLTSVATLDEGITDRLEAYTRGRPVVWFPDLADSRLPEPGDEDATLGAKIRQFAAGRKVVGCIGHLRKTKGILNLVRAASDARLRDVCFAFVGEVGLDPYTAQEQQEILDAWERNPRIFCHPMRVPDGPRLNSVLSSCDVISGAYTDFPNSSNMLTKAAAFGKPVVVNDGYLMAERVKKFGLGRVVEEDNLESLVEALSDLAMREPEAFRENPGRDLLLRQHSYPSLVQAFRKILSVGTAER